MPTDAKAKFKFSYELTVTGEAEDEKALIEEMMMKPPDYSLYSPGGQIKKSKAEKKAKTIAELSKMKATLFRFVHLVNIFDSLTAEREKEIFIEAMSFDTLLKLCHVKYFIEKSPLLATFIVRTLYATVNRQDAAQLVNILPRNMQKAVR